jgi:NADH-quinone oxidoreductase subunit C
MEPLEIVDRLKEKFLNEIVDVTQFRDQVFVSIKKEKINEICRYLHDDPGIYMDYLADLCGVDYPEKRWTILRIYAGLITLKKDIALKLYITFIP